MPGGNWRYPSRMAGEGEPAETPMPLPAFLHPCARPAAEYFLCLVDSDGALVYDDTGREYVDAMASLWFCDVGHLRGEIADAVPEQLRTIAQGTTRTPSRSCSPSAATRSSVLAEPVLGAGDVHPRDEGYLRERRRLCDGTGHGWCSTR